VIVVRRDIVERYLARGSGELGVAAAGKSYRAWLAIAEAAEWRTPVEVRRSHPKASILKRGRAVFNIKANDYRLVAQLNYAAGTLEIRFFGNHAEYDRIDAETV
jgi:mRNA interferase HigB